MVAYLPIPGGHIKLAERFVDPAFSFTMGWNYWYDVWRVSSLLSNKNQNSPGTTGRLSYLLSSVPLQSSFIFGIRRPILQFI